MLALAEIEPLKSLQLQEVPEKLLWSALMRAHDASARRDNISTITLINVVAGSYNYANGIAAACLSIGGPHAPLQHSMALLMSDDPVEQARQILGQGMRLPGWGNSFIKGKPDDLWGEVDRLIAEYWPETHQKIDGITRCIHEHGKQIFPNPSIYTAAAAIILDVPPAISPYLFIAGRLNAWTEMAGRQMV